MSGEMLSNDWRAVIFSGTQLGLRDAPGGCHCRDEGVKR